MNYEKFPKSQKVLSREEEEHYIKLLAKGDSSARNKLVESNLQLIVHIAKKYKGTIDIDDLISIGSIGLIKAVNSFSHKMGAKLGTYAARCIENEINMAIRNLSCDNKSVETLELISIESMVVVDDWALLSKQDIKEMLNEIIDKELDEHERLIIRTRYGLHGDKPATTSETAEKLGLVKEFVSRVERKAMLKLQHSLTKLLSAAKEVKETIVQKIYNTNVYGGNVAVGDNPTVIVNDFEKIGKLMVDLRSELTKNADSGLNDLRKQLETLEKEMGKAKPKKSLIKKMIGGLGKLLSTTTSYTIAAIVKELIKIAEML